MYATASRVKKRSEKENLIYNIFLMGTGGDIFRIPDLSVSRGGRFSLHSSKARASLMLKIANCLV